MALAASTRIMISNSPSSNSLWRFCNVAISCWICSSSLGDAFPAERRDSSFAIRSVTVSTSTSLLRRSIFTSASSASAAARATLLSSSRFFTAAISSCSGRFFKRCWADEIAVSILWSSIRLFWSDTEAFTSTPLLR